VTGFTSADIVLSGTAAGGTTAVVSGSGTTYNVAVSGMTVSGTVIATVPAGAAQDVAGNGNANSTSTDNTVTYDITAPTVTINQAAGQADPTNASPINFTVVFSEPVTGFTGADVALSGTAGANTAVVSGSGTIYNVAVSGMTISGTVIASIPAGGITDVVGNTNAASTSTDNTVTFDNTALTVTINQAAAQADPTRLTPINFTVVFSKPVTGFTSVDVVLSGTAGATTATITGSGTTYNVAVSGMGGTGTVIATIPAGAAQDASGNGNIASTSTDNTVLYDITVPTVTINQAAAQVDPTNAMPINFTVVFSKPVTGFTNAGVVLSGTAGATTKVVTGSGTTYNVAVSGMTGTGTVIATVPANSAQDTAGNGNANSTSTDNTVTYDVTAPTVTINQAVGQADPTNASPVNFTVVFSKPVTGFTGAGVSLTGTAAATTAVVTGSGTTYNVAVSGMTGPGTVIATVPAGVATDAVGNTNTASTSTDNTVTYDITGPTVTINQAAAQADPTNATPINFTVVFSKPVTGFIGTDVSLTGTAGATTAVVNGSGTTYNVAVSGMAGSGTVIATVPAGGAQDTSGNGNMASTSTDNTVTYDVTAPTVTINQAIGQADPTNVSPINFTVVFSKPVTGFINTDVALSGTAGATTAVVTGTGTTYNVAVSGMTGSGTVIATVPAGAALDAVGNSNANSTSTDNVVTYDTIRPTVTINQAATQTDPTGASPLYFTVVFSESANAATFTGADVALSGTAGATTAVVTGSGTTYTVAVSGMTVSGTVIATIPVGGVQDLAGNTNLASTSTDNTITYDVTLPSVTINQTIGQADPTNGSPISFTVVFSKPMTGFATGDVTLSGTAGATTAIVSGGGTTYSVSVSGMTGSGTVIAAISANVATDSSGNGNSASTSTDNTVTYDIIRPTVTINQAVGQADPTSFSPIYFSVVFSEPVTGFTGAGITLSGTAGATIAVVSGGGSVYNVAVSGMSGTGTVIATVNVAAAADLANNTNFASTSTDNTVTYDITVPTVTINQAIGQADPTNASPINFTVVFSKPVTGFTSADIVLSGTAAGGATAVVSGSGTTYNVVVSGMTGSGTVIATVPAGAAQDTAGNGNANSTSTDNTVTYDVTAPTVTINQAVDQADPTNASPINFTVVFSETVTGFANTDVILTGTAGANTAVVTGSGTTYNVAVSGMAGSGTVIASVAAGGVADVVGNINTASTSTDNTVTFDTSVLTVTINQAAAQADPTNVSPINFTVIFSKPVTGFTNADVRLAGTAGATTAVVTGSGTTYNVSVSSMTGSGTVIATIPAGVATDMSGNGNAASSSTDNTVIYDITAPTVTINQAAAQADPTNTAPINFTVIFSEPVTGLTGADVVLIGTAGATTAVLTGSGTTYNVAVSGMVRSGTVIATIPAGNALDAAGNGNANSTSTDNSVTYDVTAPTVTINQAVTQVDPTNASPIDFTVIFSKPVTGFTNADVTLAGTALPTTATVTGSGTTYTVSVSGMTNSGTVIASIVAGVATDALGNTNTASTSTDNIVTFDNSTLSVTINQAAAQADPTNAAPINFTVIFNKPVTGFTNTDVRIAGTSGATTAVVTGSGTTYNVAVSSMTNSGTVIATIPTGVAQDVSGNTNAASTSTDNTVTYDITAPTVTINQAASQADPTGASPINFTVIFSEPVTGLTGADVVLTGTAGATTAVLTGSGTTYNVAVSGMTASGTVIATVPAGNALDAAGNGNVNSTSGDNIVTYDFTPTPVTINQSGAQADPTRNSPIMFDVIFSKAVTGFTGTDVSLGGTANPTTADVTGSGANYTVAVSGMTNDGTVIVTIPAGVATDALGNVNAASTSTDNVVMYDTTGPAVTINQAVGQPDPTGISPVNFTVVFSEPVTGFTGADLNLGGSTGANTAVVTGSGITYSVAVSGMTSSGTLIVTITDDAAIDAAGNPSQASTSTDNAVKFDMGAPSVTINQATSQVDPTNTPPINFTVVFSKPVTGFTGTDVALTGTAVATSAVVTGTGTTYNVEVSGMIETGTVIATIPADRAKDVAGNGNLASTSTDNTVIYDNAPVCSDLAVTTAEDIPVQVAPACTDVDGNSLTYSIVTQPSNGSASVVVGNLSFSPALNLPGEYSFTYKANDGFINSAPATVEVIVTAVPDPPIDIGLSANTVEDGSPVGTLVGTLSTIDPDNPDDTFTYSLLDNATYPDNASFQISGDQLQTLGVFSLVGKLYTINIQVEDSFGYLYAEEFIITVVPKTIPPKRAVFRSRGVYDGWILESSETSNLGGTLNATATTFNLGDDAANRQYRAILDFDTSRLPDNAIITRVTLQIKRQGQVGINPFLSLGNIMLDVRDGAFRNDNALQLYDFRYDASLNACGTMVNKPVSNWYSVNLASTSFHFVSPTTTTQFRLRFWQDDNNDKRANYIRFYSGNAAVAYRPRLIIEYYVP
jgi:hypothetical protein